MTPVQKQLDAILGQSGDYQFDGNVLLGPIKTLKCAVIKLSPDQLDELRSLNLQPSFSCEKFRKICNKPFEDKLNRLNDLLSEDDN